MDYSIRAAMPVVTIDTIAILSRMSRRQNSKPVGRWPDPISTAAAIMGGSLSIMKGQGW